MVGREGQLESLKSLLDVVRAGRSRVALLIGEPGIGKSRLLSELRTWATAQDPDPDRPAATWAEGRCLSYGRNLPYHLVIDLVRSMLELSPGTSGAEARAELDRGVSAILGDEAADASAYLAHLLDLPLRPDESARISPDPEVLQGRYAAVAHRLVRGRSASRPLVLVLEDIHWADPASVDLIRGLLPLAVQHPVLFLAATRNEPESAGWGLVSLARELFSGALTEIHLEALSDADSRRLVANLLEIESLPDHVREVILTRAEGNPFFVEEVIRMLIGRGVIRREGDRWLATAEVESVVIPENLHGLLLARIDQLPDDAKRSLRVAAVIGRQFPLRVLERVLAGTAE
jgi:predicted ATPase